MKKIVKYKVAGDMKGLLGYFEDGTYYHIHSNELSKLEKWILKFILTENKKIEKLKEVTKIQCSKGNYDVNEYMRGMANGLILAEAIMEDKDPKYIETKT